MNLTLTLEALPARRGDVEAAVARFRELSKNPESPIRAIRHVPARAAEFSPLPDNLDARVVRALEARGIGQLYSHQAEALAAIEAGRNVVIVTPTASGKTLCYNLPVWNRLLEEPEARAFYLFPTKALAEDQLTEFNAGAEAMGGSIRAFTYDGDTPQDARKAIRQRANVVLTNPDMLHAGILPHHTKWAKVFEKLRYVVIDELHYYRGVYGSHLSNILRRMRRICEFYGSKPQFVCSSATIANPKSLAETLTAEEFHAVDRSGAPAGERYFVFFNPPVVNKQLGIRRSYLHESRRIATELIERGQQTLVFCNNRLATEILVTYLKDACDRLPMGPDMVRGYRGGYLPKERREIERLLRDGSIRAVVATNALELGIDVGSLDGVVMAGYPGTIASTWQRSGRAGRRQTAALSVLVASSAPLDQFIVEHPDYFFGQPPESAHVNPDNVEILINHVKCAAFELPVTDGEKFGPHNASELCAFLRDNGLLHEAGGAWHWTSDTYPADAVNLRSVSSDNFVVVDETKEPRVIAEVAFTAALEELHEKAIYLHEARQYQVERFDYDNRKAYVRRVECDYYTDAMVHTQVKEIDQFECAEIQGAYARHGEVRVNRQVVGFKKIKFYTNENVGAGHLSLPEQELHTTAFWVHFPETFLNQFADLSPTEKQAGLIGIGNAFRAVAALLLMCDPRDLGVALTEDIEAKPRAYEPSLFLYDNYPGGVGLSAPLHAAANKLISMSCELIRNCACEAGCPSCVGPLGEAGERAKEAAVRILNALLVPVSEASRNSAA